MADNEGRQLTDVSQVVVPIECMARIVAVPGGVFAEQLPDVAAQNPGFTSNVEFRQILGENAFRVGLIFVCTQDRFFVSTKRLPNSSDIFNIEIGNVHDLRLPADMNWAITSAWYAGRRTAVVGSAIRLHWVEFVRVA